MLASLPRRIGANRREAIDWIQDRWHLQRPLAEATVLDQMRAGRLVATDFGMLLFETDDETEQRSRRLSHDYGRHAFRLRFRNRPKSNRRFRGRYELSYQPQNRGPKSSPGDDDAAAEAAV